MQIVMKKFFQGADRASAILRNNCVVVDMRNKKALELSIARRKFLAESCQPFWRSANIIHVCRTGELHAAVRRLDQVSDQKVQDLLESLVEFQFFLSGGMHGMNTLVSLAKHRDSFAKRLEIQDLRLECIINVSGVVGNLVHTVDQLRFEWRLQIQQVLGELRKLGRRILTRMLDDAFTDFERQIQARKFQIALLEFLNNAQRVQVVIERTSV